MDDKDKRLLSLLRRNARLPIVALARELNLSRSATQERLAKLEKSGAVAGYTVVEGSPNAARQSAHILVRLEPGRHCSQIVPRIRGLPYITGIDSITGVVDMIVNVDADTMESVEEIRNAIAKVAGVAGVTTHMVLHRHVAVR